DDRDGQRQVVAQQPAGLLGRVGRRDHTLLPGGRDGESAFRRQRSRGAEYDVAGTLLDDGRVLPAPALRTGGERGLPERHRRRPGDARLGLIDGKGPAGAGGVPVELVVIGEEADLATGAVTNHVFVPAVADQPVGAADAQAHAVAELLAAPRLGSTV